MRKNIMEMTTTVNKSLLLLFIILILMLVITYFYKAYQKAILKNIKESPELILIYLDKYYINNITVVIFNTMLYFGINVILLVWLRSKYFLDYFGQDIKLDFSFTISNFYLLINILLLLVNLILFKILLNKLFYDELIKLHLFFYRTSAYLEFCSFIRKDYCIDLFGKIYLFLFNVCKLRALRDLNDLSDYCDFFIYETIYENDKIIKLSQNLVELSKRYGIILLLMKLLRFIFKILFYHIRVYDGFIPYIPRILFMIVIFYNYLWHMQYNIYYIFFIYYFFTFIIDTSLFIIDKDCMIDGTITRYFYYNPVNYSLNRVNLKNNLTSYFETLKSCPNNFSLIWDINNLSLYKYLINDFKDPDYRKSLASLYKRITFILMVILISYTLYVNNNIYITVLLYKIKLPITILLLPVLGILIFISKKAYRIIREPDDESYNNTIYETNKKNNRLFWIIALFTISFMGYIYIGSKMKGLEVYHHIGIIDIIRYHTIEEKISVFYEYLELYMKRFKLEGQDVANLNLFIKEFNIEMIIFEDTTLRELALFIEDLIIRYIIKAEELQYNTFYSWSKFLKNSLAILIITKTLLYFYTKTLPKFILETFFKEHLFRLVRDTFENNAIFLDMTEEHMTDFLYLIVRIIIRDYDAWDILKFLFGR